MIDEQHKTKKRHARMLAKFVEWFGVALTQGGRERYLPVEELTEREEEPQGCFYCGMRRKNCRCEPEYYEDR